MRKGNLFVISGPAGVGKGTLVSMICDRVPDAWLSISATTRQPRGEEVDGVQYFFLSKDEFLDKVEHDGFLEWAEYAGNYYGTPLDAVESHIKAGHQVILEIEVQGALQIRQKMPDATLIFIEPPSKEVLEERLRGRMTDSEESIRARLQTAHSELAQKGSYDFCVVNDHLEDALAKLVGLIDSKASGQ